MSITTPVPFRSTRPRTKQTPRCPSRSLHDRGQTSLPGVFAAGDCTTVPYKQIVIALGAGATAALSAFDHLIRTSAPDEALAVAG